MNFHYIFTNYVASEKINLNLNHLIDYCYKQKELDVGRTVSNIGGWQSQNLNLEDDELQSVIKSIVDVAKKVRTEFSINEEFFINNIWININGKSDFNRPHIHPQSIISGIIYIKTPENCGNLVFKNPNLAVGEFERLFNSFNNLTATYHEYRVEENSIYMFPSWLEHFVEPNRNNEERISMAFNIGVVKND